MIDDQTLLAELRKSKLEPINQAVLEPLIPQMDEGQRSELSGFIQQSHKVGKKEMAAETAKNQEILALNTETDSELNRIEKETAEIARREIEKLEQQRAQKEMTQLESDIGNM